MHHNWIPSTLGYGGTICSRCFVTKREAAALGTLGHCDVLVAPAPVQAISERGQDADPCGSIATTTTLRYSPDR